MIGKAGNKDLASPALFTCVNEFLGACYKKRALSVPVFSHLHRNILFRSCAMESLLLSSVDSDNHFDVLPLPPELLDSDLFALLYPVNNPASVAIQQDCNATRYVAPPAEEDVDSQESTPAPASRPFLDSGYLALRFSDTDKGYWTLGRNNSCDVILQGRGISKRHCEIICDSDLSFQLRDMSTYGTAVSYDGKDLEFNKNCVWLIANYRGPLLWLTMLFRIGNMDFHILLPNHHRLDEEYLDKIHGFQEARLPGLSALSSLDVQSLTTTIEPGTPVEPSIPVSPEPENILAVSERGIKSLEECLSGQLETMRVPNTRVLLAKWINSLLPNRQHYYGAYGERRAKNRGRCPWWPLDVPYSKPATLSKHGKRGNYPFSQVLISIRDCASRLTSSRVLRANDYQGYQEGGSMDCQASRVEATPRTA